MKHKVALLAGLALILLAGCGDKLPTDIPDVVGYSGLVAQGWEAYDRNDYTTAMDYFQQAIDVDVTRPEAYLGAGYASIHLSDYWVIGGDYFFMASQLDGGKWPIASGETSIDQDPGWTVFECIDPVLSDETMSVIEAYGETWYDWPVDGDVTPIDNYIIGAFLYGAPPFNAAHNDPQSPKYGNVPFKYRWESDIPGFFLMTSAVNDWSTNAIGVDSLAVENGNVVAYLNVPYRLVSVSGTNYRTWIMAEHTIKFDYATYDMPSGATAITRDAIAGYAALQMVRGLSGDMLTGVAAAIGLYDGGDYSFEHSGTNRNNVLGMGAAMSFLNQDFRFTLYVVRHGGFGMGINVADPDFLVELAQTIQTMLND